MELQYGDPVLEVRRIKLEPWLLSDVVSDKRIVIAYQPRVYRATLAALDAIAATRFLRLDMRAQSGKNVWSLPGAAPMGLSRPGGGSMVPREAPSAYFPPLDDCLNQRCRLLSWQDVFLAICELEYNSVPLDGSVARFLDDPRAVQALAQAFEPPTKPTPQSRATFEALTAAINVAPTTKGPYNIAQLKDDAVALSQKGAIDEVSALRLVILLWQHNAENDLAVALRGASPTHHATATSSRDDLNALVGSSRSTFPAGSNLYSRSANTRLGRGLRLMLDEREYLTKVAQDLITRIAIPKSSLASPRRRVENESTARLAVCADRVLDLSPDDVFNLRRRYNLLFQLIEQLRRIFQDLQSATPWELDDDVSEQLVIDRFRVLNTELVHAMETILACCLGADDIPPAGIISGWFRLMDNCHFMDSNQSPVSDDFAALRTRCEALSALISLSLLKPSVTLAMLPEVADAPPPQEPADDWTPFIRNMDCMEATTRVFLEACGAINVAAGPASFAWSILLQSVGDLATAILDPKINRPHVPPEALPSSETSGLGNPGKGPLSSRRSSLSSEASQLPAYANDLAEAIQRLEPNDDPVLLLATGSLTRLQTLETLTTLAEYCQDSVHVGSDGAIADMSRLLLLDLITEALNYVNYGSEIVAAVLATLRESSTSPHESCNIDLALQFLNTPALMEKIFSTSLARFPYEMTPFLRLCSVLCATNDNGLSEKTRFVENYLENLDSFTSAMDENAYSFKINFVDELPVELHTSANILFLAFPFAWRQTLGTLQNVSTSMATASQESIVIPTGSRGQILKRDKPIVVRWLFRYSGLHFMGLTLQLALDERTGSQNSSKGFLFDICGEIIAFLTTTITVEAPSSASNERTRSLEQASECLRSDTDVIALIFDLLEGEACRSDALSQEQDSSLFLVRCMDFLVALLSVCPDRVWTFLSNSRLLGLGGSESRLVSAIARLELPTGRYPLLSSCLRLLDGLMADAVAYRPSSNKAPLALTRFGAVREEIVGLGTTADAVGNILLALTKMFVDILESSNGWHFESMRERVHVDTRIFELFSLILRLNPSVTPTSSPTKVLRRSAAFVLDAYISDQTSELTLNSILQQIDAGTATPSSTIAVDICQEWRQRTLRFFDFLQSLLRLRVLRSQTMSRLEKALASYTSALLELYIASPRYRLPVVSTLELLLRGESPNGVHGAAPFSSLTDESMKRFMDVLNQFDEPYEDLGLRARIWKFLSVAISQRQQWFATWLVNGVSPRESLRHGKDTKENDVHRNQTMFGFAITRLGALSSLQVDEALAVIDFIISAIDYWPWLMAQLLQNSSAINELQKPLATLSEPTTMSVPAQVAKATAQYTLAAKCASLLALVVHESKGRGDRDFAQRLLPSLVFFIQCGSVTAPTPSALGNGLTKLLEAACPSCELAWFLSDPGMTSAYTSDAFDNLSTDTILALQFAKNPRWEKAIKLEFDAASAQQAATTAQLTLFSAWKTLAIELSCALTEDASFRQKMFSIACNCVDAIHQSLDSNVPEDLTMSRAQLALALLQRCIGLRSDAPAPFQALQTTWSSLKQITNDIGLTLAQPESELARILLNVVFVLLQLELDIEYGTRPPGDRGASRADDIGNLLLDILENGVSRPFRDLTSCLHQDPTSVSPADFALLIAILRACIQHPRIDRHAEILAGIFVDGGTLRYASTLFSWAIELAIGSDPLYGQVSLSLLCELSRIPTLAEAIILDGVLSDLSTSKLMTFYRRPGGTGAFDQPLRLHTMWTADFLPLLLNVLSSVGAAAASDVAALLNSFPEQLARASRSFELKSAGRTAMSSAGAVTLHLASEAQLLATLTRVLDLFRTAGTSAGIVAADVPPVDWDHAAVRMDLESLLQRRDTLRDRLTPLDSREEGLLKTRPRHPQSGAESRYEEMVVEEMRTALALLSDEA